MAEVVENEIDQESLAAFKDAETKFGECQLSVSMLDVNCKYIYVYQPCFIVRDGVKMAYPIVITSTCFTQFPG